MARRNNSFNSEKNIGVMLGGGIIIVGIIAFIISYVLYSNSIRKDSKTLIDNTLVSKNNSVNMIETNVEEASSSIGKSINEVENSESNKVAVNTSNIEKNEETKNENLENKSAENKETENVLEEPENNVEETKKDPSFTFPVSGEILKEYSKDTLVYSETLEEWTTHLGIDFKANKTEVVKAAADGIVKSIKNDPRYGLTIVIEHDNGFESVYASLLSSEFVTVGEEVKQGGSIGTVGNTATFEIADETHLHFEIKQNGQSVDPSIYLK